MNLAIDKAVVRTAGSDTIDSRSRSFPGHEQRLAALVAREERRQAKLDQLADLRRRRRRGHRPRRACRNEQPKGTPRPITLTLSRRRDGRWQK